MAFSPPCTWHPSSHFSFFLSSSSLSNDFSPPTFYFTPLLKLSTREYRFNYSILLNTRFQRSRSLLFRSSLQHTPRPYTYSTSSLSSSTSHTWLGRDCFFSFFLPFSLSLSLSLFLFLLSSNRAVGEKAGRGAKKSDFRLDTKHPALPCLNSFERVLVVGLIRGSNVIERYRSSTRSSSSFFTGM